MPNIWYKVHEPKRETCVSETLLPNPSRVEVLVSSRTVGWDLAGIGPGPCGVGTLLPNLDRTSIRPDPGRRRSVYGKGNVSTISRDPVSGNLLERRRSSRPSATEVRVPKRHRNSDSTPNRAGVVESRVGINVRCRKVWENGRWKDMK